MDKFYYWNSLGYKSNNPECCWVKGSKIEWKREKMDLIS